VLVVGVLIETSPVGFRRAQPGALVVNLRDQILPDVNEAPPARSSAVVHDLTGSRQIDAAVIAWPAFQLLADEPRSIDGGMSSDLPYA
jgi:hypothetical protein